MTARKCFDVGAFDSVADPLNLTLQHDRERNPVATTADGTLEVKGHRNKPPS